MIEDLRVAKAMGNKLMNEPVMWLQVSNNPWSGWVDKNKTHLLHPAIRVNWQKAMPPPPRN